MKFCLKCGSQLNNEKAAFCPECGEQLSDSCTDAHKATAKKKASSRTDKKSKKEKKKKPPKKAKKAKEEAPIQEVIGEAVEDDYDGYYNDVLPPDLDREKEGLDRKLIKNIVFLGIAFLFVIGMCVAMLYIL